MHFQRFAATLSTAFIAVFAASGPANAETYPDKPIRLIVPFAAGGPTDVLVRLIGPALSTDLGQPVVIENKAGAGSAIGIADAARAKPDGYTFVVAGSAYAINASFMPNLPYDTLGDLQAVTPLAITPFFLVANGKLPVSNISELISLAKKSPGRVTYASSGTGNSPHLAGVQFAAETKTELLHVPYKGTGPAINDLLGGVVDIIFTGLPSVLSHVQSGRLKVLAVASDQRVPFAINVPTMAEAGVRGFNADAWFGILAPAGVPESRKQRFAAAVHKAIHSPEVVNRFATLGALPMDLEVAQFQTFIEKDVTRWSEFFAENSNLTPE